MLTPTQHARLANKCASTLAKAIDSLPGFLEKAEAEEAALVVADLIKAVLTAPLPKPDPAAALNNIIDKVRRDFDANKEMEERTQQ